jgi:hypothetical protein
MTATPRHNVLDSSGTSRQLSTIHTYEIRDTVNKNGGKYARLRHHGMVLNGDAN